MLGHDVEVLFVDRRSSDGRVLRPVKITGVKETPQPWKQPSTDTDDSTRETMRWKAEIGRCFETERVSGPVLGSGRIAA